MTTQNTQLDLLDDVIAYEQGNMDGDETIQFFQELVNTGLAWRLQGHYGRTANAMIDRGTIQQK